MQLLLAGASGLIGTALRSACVAAGDDVRVLVRRSPTSDREIEWHPESGKLDQAALDGIDGVICLSGVGVGEHRWSPAFREEILTSRTSSVATLARAIGAAARPPRVFLSGSAIGYYGDTGAQVVDESTPAGEGFFPDVCRQWEAASKPAESSQTRVAHLRTGVVLARSGPVLARMMPLFRLGLGGRLGSGRQYWSMISLADEVAAIRFLLNADISGPVNLTTPQPVTNAEFTRTLAKLMHRPAFFAVPEFALRIVVDGFAGEILGSQRVRPQKLIDAGFEFRHPTVEAALRAELGYH